MAILQKYNWKFDFETDKLNIPIDSGIFNKYDINAHEYITAFIAVGLGQIYDPKKVTFKYELNGFYLDVYIEQLPIKWGIVFVRTPEHYTNEQIEILKNICHTLGIKLFFVYLYGENADTAYTATDGNVYCAVAEDESLADLDFKTKGTFAEVFRKLFPKLSHEFDEVYDNRIDTQLCYRLGILLSIIPKKEEPVKQKKDDYKDYVASMVQAR